MILAEGPWVFSTISSSVATVIMMIAYRDMGKDVRRIQLEMFRLNIRLTGRDYGTGIPSMAEDTEVGK